MTDQLENSYDVVVVGGGAAGLNGALMLARSRRSVAVIDSGAPRNAPNALGVHGLLAREGVSPTELVERGRAEVRGYGDRLLVTTGLVDLLPEIPGLRERWGRDVLHCPYCHGWEVRDQAIGVLATGPMSVHQALLFRQLSGDVTYFTHHSAGPDAEQDEQLAARGIRVVTGAVTAVEVADDRLVGVRLADGTVVRRHALSVAPRLVARAGFLAGLGLRAVDHPSGVGEYVPADPFGRTEAAGVWVAGNVSDLAAQVGAAAAGGAVAAAAINTDLIAEETREAVAAARSAESR
ncbi:NAD(P)/FAD-dependent oxidoreductase [Salinispora arenicola]|uniref:NAD(P)/FAD-dependent oxidoreductase n=1 Tax=Salinispora arenicola TaxID=168697 RepID=UPI002079A253|nr:NAD(P)/FAD-dependent oxidoreductase [Salinispora arenicola]MCN0151751.1 NAD(P)/FAD-dependent oxidoreductase [Salinispora arenicola]